MNWFTKALAFKALSGIPGGAAFYRHAQWNWTKSIVATPDRVNQKLNVGMGYLKWLLDHGHDLDCIRAMRHLDLGCGWHPTIPLLFSRIGMRDQVLTDLTPLMTSETFLDTLSLSNRLLGDPGHQARNLLAGQTAPEAPSDTSLDSLLDRFHMQYRAPYFAWASNAGQCIDLVTCTQVLMHIERPLLDECFKLVHGLLKPGGIFMAPVHLFDIYSNSDSRISIYNHLRYSNTFWRSVVNSDMMTFNRLKSPDFREALEGSGFEILEFDVEQGGADDLKSLQSIKIHPEFTSRYTRQQLLEKHLFFVARKP